MISVFSDKKMTDKIRSLQKCAGSNYTRVLLAGPSEEPLYMLKPQIINWLTWINTHILFELPKVKTQKDAQWVGVRVRIATNMLNKCEGVISKEMCNVYHKRLTENIRKILGEIYIEDLPF